MRIDAGGPKREVGLKTTVGDLIAAIFDVVGDRVDQAVDLLRYEERRALPHLLVKVPSATRIREANHSSRQRRP